MVACDSNDDGKGSGSRDVLDGGSDGSGSESVVEELAFTLNSDGTYYVVSGIGTLKAASVQIPATYKDLPVKEIGEKAFSGQTQITSVTIPSSITTIKGYAFAGCEGLEEIFIPSSVKTMGGYVFKSCSSDLKIKIQASKVPTSWHYKWRDDLSNNLIMGASDSSNGGVVATGRKFCFTVDDNIYFLKELTENNYSSIFEHPYMAMYKRLHDNFNLKIQFNLFYSCEGFDLSMMTDKYKAEWEENSDWIKLSFHSELENVDPYKNAGYDEVKGDCDAVNREIVRFAGEKSLGKTTTVHYCLATEQGLDALKDCGVQGLLGLFGTPESPRTSYGLSDDIASQIRDGEIINNNGIAFSGIDIILNSFEKPEILRQLDGLFGRETIRVMIHEQYFRPEYHGYQEDFEEKIRDTFLSLYRQGYESVFFEDIIQN